MRRLVVLVGLFGCSLATDLSGLGGDASTDASSVDAGSVDVLSDSPSANDVSGPDAGGNRVVNGAFETQGPACGGGWNAIGGTMTSSSTSHSGNSSCLICIATGDHTNVHATPYPDQSPHAGDGYSAEAWVMTIPNADVAQTALDLDEITTSGATTFAFVAGDQSVQGWQRIQITTATAPSDGTQIDFAIHLTSVDGGPGGCMLVDDVSLTKQ